MITVDTSVAIAAALPWHEAHNAALVAWSDEPMRAIGEVVLETYSVLTRLPPPNRVGAGLARGYLESVFALPALALSADGYAQLLSLVSTEGIVGGAVYDALVAATAREGGLTLVSLDRRAASVYERVGVEYRIIG